jgi:V/A-type H+-transporting ATPase subunit D
MLAFGSPQVAGLVRMERLRLGEENVVGVRLPRLEGVDFTVADYALLSTPPWLELLVERLQGALTLRAQVTVGEARVRRLDRALRRITQRVNLFEKVLIPTIRRNIRRIQAFLADGERAAVVRSKLAKAMHVRTRVSQAPEPLPSAAGLGGAP